MQITRRLLRYVVGIIGLLVLVPLIGYSIIANLIPLVIWAPFFALSGLVIYLGERLFLRKVKGPSAPYTMVDWIKEDGALKRGADPPPCPRCRRRGFYAPRLAPGRCYRACKFCGFWQDVGKPPHKIIRYQCAKSNHDVADWKEPHESWTCPACGTQYSPADAVPWPAQNSQHAWHKAPLTGSQADYAAFWAKQGLQFPFGIP